MCSIRTYLVAMSSSLGRKSNKFGRVCSTVSLSISTLTFEPPDMFNRVFFASVGPNHSLHGMKVHRSRSNIKVKVRVNKNGNAVGMFWILASGKFF